MIKQVKLIAEPWDLGEGGYQVGNFPRDGRNGTASAGRDPLLLEGRWRPGGQLASRLSGSSDLFEQRARTDREHQLHLRRTTASPCMIS